jgi:Asp-tRNA(Asn)/Glu-tRNA(Gln) amidotransferase A subunit family amidase
MWFEIVRALAYERLEHSAEISPRLARQLETGMAIEAEVYDQALAYTAAARAGLDAFFGSRDAILVPAAPGEAPAGLGNTGNPIFNRMWTLLRVPCVTLPARWGDNGLPTGIQLVGREHDDARLMACAAFLEKALAEAA